MQIEAGFSRNWADKYGIRIKLTQINDYVESINQYTAGGFDACVMTNMDMLTIPAAGGVDSTALIAGDFSNGNDGVVLKGKGRSLADIKGQKVNLVELSVSHYLLMRALSSVGLRERDVKIVNTSDADIVGAFATPASTAVVTWKPQLSAVLSVAPGAQLVFDSSKIPGEIMDLMVVNTATLAANPKLGKALVGAWYETITLMLQHDAAGAAAIAAMAKASGTDGAGYQAQLADDALVRGAFGRVRLHERRCRHQEHGSCASFLLRSRHSGAGRAIRGRGGHSQFPSRQAARRPRKHQDALRSALHQDGRRRPALSRRHAAAHQSTPQSPAGGRLEPAALCRAPCRLSGGLPPEAGCESGRQAAPRADDPGRGDPSVRIRGG